MTETSKETVLISDDIIKGLCWILNWRKSMDIQLQGLMSR